MTTGLLRRAGYYHGSKLLRPSTANERGFYEDKEINALNERILGQAISWNRLPRRWIRHLWNSRFCRGELWLSHLEEPHTWRLSAVTKQKITEFAGRQPFAYKDPRFSYTLNAWQPFLPDNCRYLVIYRNPAETCRSMVSFARRFHTGMQFDFEHAQQVWLAMYRQILEFHYDGSPQWLFVDFGRLLDGSAFPTIEQFLACEIDRDFVDRKLVHSSSTELPLISQPARATYEELHSVADQTQDRLLNCVSQRSREANLPR